MSLTIRHAQILALSAALVVPVSALVFIGNRLANDWNAAPSAASSAPSQEAAGSLPAKVEPSVLASAEPSDPVVPKVDTPATATPPTQAVTPAAQAAPAPASVAPTTIASASATPPSAPAAPAAAAPSPETADKVATIGPSPDGAGAGDGDLDDTATGSVRRRKQITVLQIGDSHTAADFFTGEVRRYLQAKYGNGSAGYMEVGKPHPGVLSSNLQVKASSGWTYSGIQQRSADVGKFAFSGFRAHTSQENETVSFQASQGLPYTDIDIEVEKGPGQGAIDVSLDGRVATHVSLDETETKKDIVHIQTKGGIASLRQLEIKSTEAKPTSILSVGFFNKRSGLSYSNLGFPGATVDILNKFPQATVIEALQRLSPRIVVLAFGTNEGFNDDLDLDVYRARYLKVIETVRAGAPRAKIVMIGPSDANRVPHGCTKGHEGCKKPDSSAKTVDHANGSQPKTGDAKSTDAKAADVKTDDDKPSIVVADTNKKCPYPTPPQLDRVRALQREIAAQNNIPFWDWSSLMPKRCGAETWVSATPHLMTADHVHFTKDGYRRCGRAFAAYLDPIVSQALRDSYVVSNH